MVHLKDALFGSIPGFVVGWILCRMYYAKAIALIKTGVTKAENTVNKVI